MQGSLASDLTLSDLRPKGHLCYISKRDVFRINACVFRTAQKFYKNIITRNLNKIYSKREWDNRENNFMDLGKLVL